MKWFWALWVLMFVALEAFAIWDSAPNDTLTQVTLHTVPGFVIVLFLGWLTAHFVRRIVKGRRDGL